jgi:L-alanine-DL-glutamate epimerase-like enolase superfamily enzyme
MRVEAAELHFLEIPFRLSVTHGARAGRTSSDSLVLKLFGGGRSGYGEAVVREYVSGSLGAGEDFQREAARITTSLLAPLRDRDLSWQEAAEYLAGLDCDSRSLPLLCAVETALLALAIAEAGGDAYTFLSMEPQRTSVVYGGVFPMLPLEQGRKYLDICAAMKLADLKVKVGTDAAYTAAILSLCRERLGGACDLRVDANGAWSTEDAESQMEICVRHGVRVIEQPFHVSAKETSVSLARMKERGFTLVADEGILGAADVRSIAASGVYQMLNLRLSKNGGLFRVLALAREAEASGLAYQLGCMVGETGILSALGRLTASLLPKPAYLEGGYDDALLAGNVTTRSFGFGQGGRAEIVRGRGIGYEVDEQKLATFSRARLPV